MGRAHHGLGTAVRSFLASVLAVLPTGKVSLGKTLVRQRF